MNLKCKVNGKEYNLAQGIPFSDEYNETLDSCSVIIPHCKGKINMYPYDDFYVYNKDENFYKHYLIHQFNEENINLVDKIYTYKIELFSETKGLEIVQLPNISVTQAVYVDKKKSVYQYICDFIDLYNPKVKFVENSEEKTWVFKGKYKIADTTCNPRNSLLENNLKGIFGNVFAPEFTLNNPNLRDLLAKLFLVKDMIPVVEDNVIYAMDITKRRGEFNAKDVNYIAGSRSSENHCDNLRRTYYDALSQDYSARRVEMLGFRNSSTPLLTIANMRLETNFPIYKINKVYMCYYKKIFIRNNNAILVDGETYCAAGSYYYTENDSKVYFKCKITGDYTEEDLYDESYFTLIKNERAFLCKQDITKLVQLNSRRELLSKDWDDFVNLGKEIPTTIDELAEYKLCTVGYDIGSKYITGWGEMYTYPQGFWDIKKTYIQNISQIVDRISPFGIYDYDYFAKDLNENETISTNVDFFDSIISPVFQTNIKSENLNKLLFGTAMANKISIDDVNDSIKMKSLFFEVDYNAFISGTVVHSKDLGRDNITNNDNTSSSLTMVGPDGLYQKEKINRFGNKGYVFTARHASINDLQPLGSVYSNDDIDDVVIYHREYSICDNVVVATYYGMHDYVLKNYFTSVYAKHRPYSLMSYGESIRRSENDKTLLVLSKDNVLFERISKDANKDVILQRIAKLFSFYKKSSEDEQTGNYITPDKINYAYITHEKNGNIDYYATDVNAFVSGNSLCFNMSMYDNASMGVYIKKAVPEFNIAEGTIFDWEDTTKDITGSVQDWYMLVDDEETGYVNKMGFYLCHLDKQSMFADGIISSGDFELKIADTIDLIDVTISEKNEEKALKKFKEYNLISYEENVFTFMKTTIDSWLGYGFSEDTIYLGTTEDLLNDFGIDVQFEENQQPTFKIVVYPTEIEESIATTIDKINILPKIEKTKIDNATNTIGDIFVINKDNKEIIDMTYQYEPITTDKNVMFSSLIMHLSDLITTYSKRSSDVVRTKKAVDGDNISLYTATNPQSRQPVLVFEIPKNVFDDIDSYNMLLDGKTIGEDTGVFSGEMNSKGILYKLEMDFKKVESIDENEIVLIYRQKIVLSTNEGTWWAPDYVKNEFVNDNMRLKLKRIIEPNKPINGAIIYPNDENYYYTNNDFSGDIIFPDCDIEYINGEQKVLGIGELNPAKIRAFFGDFPMTYNSENEKFEFTISEMKKNNIFLSKGEYEIKSVDEKNMYVVISQKEFNKTIVYDEFKAEEETITIDGHERKVYSNPNLIISDKLLVPSVFSFETDEKGRPYIKVNLARISKKTKSVQYWFRDDESGSFKFVFGVNVTDDDFKRGFVKIYISMVKSRDTRVFNEHYEVIGNVVNFADDNNKKIYGENQYYCDIIE